MINNTRVMLVEDNQEYRDVVQLALEQIEGLELVDQFGTAEIAIRKLEETPPERQPDLILLDLRLPGISGLAALPQIRRCVPDIKIIVLTQSDREQDVLQAISSGASGYLLKSATLQEITDSIQTVIAGGAPLDKSVARFIVESLQSRLPKDDDQHLLSDREQQIIRLLADGLVKKEIARRLSISYSTVDTHVAHIYEKLGVSNAPSAVDRAHRMGLFPPQATDN